MLAAADLDRDRRRDETTAPMRILTSYVLAEVLKVFAVALTALTLMMILVGVVKEARDQGLEPRQVLQIIPYILPDALRYTVPGTILFAVCSVYGRMSGSNEIVALKSLGISPTTILWPVMVLAVLLSLVTVYLNDLAVSWGRSNVRRIVVESVEEIAYSMLRAQRTFSAPKFSIIVKRVDDRKLIQPTISFQANGDDPAITLTAEEAELRADTKQMVLTILCRNGNLDITGQGRLRFQDVLEREVPLDSASPAGEDTILPAWLSMSVIPEHVRLQRIKLRDYGEHRAAKTALELLTGDYAALNGAITRTEHEHVKFQENHLSRLLTEPQRRWSNGFSCLCFVLIGAPMAIWRRNADFLTSFFACFFPILVIYYPLLALGVDQAKAGKLPPCSVWLGNVILVAMGAWLLRKIIRY
jgi:lipopolysaccharide export system permease protein